MSDVDFDTVGGRRSLTLPVRSVEKPWGKDILPAPFPPTDGRKIGEIWFEPPAALDQLLVKYIFASEKLSVQVHPSDAQTEAQGLGRQGKEECWLVIDAEPGATLGVGFSGPCDEDSMRAAALDGSIEDRIVWHPVSPGDFFYIPANTVHAIGAGVSLIEVQQNSDITYRLYDYGRPRPLHVEEGMAVAHGEVHDARHRLKLPEHGEVRLVDGPYFTLDRIDGPPSGRVVADYGAGPLLVIPLSAGLTIAGEPINPGNCVFCASIVDLQVEHGGQALFTRPLATA